MGKLGKYIRPYAWFIVLTTFIKFSGAILELQIPSLMEKILDEFVPAGAQREIWIYGLLMFLCAAACLAANIIANRMSAVSSGRITLKLRHDLFDRLDRLSAKQMDELTVSSAESRLTSDTYNINQFLARVQRLGIRAPILLLGGIVMTLSMDVGLALVLVALLPLVGIIIYFVTKTSVPIYTQQQSVLDRMVQVLQENITGIRVIKALSKTEYEKERFHKVNRELTATDMRAGAVTAITNPANTLILNLGLVLVVVVGAQRVSKGLCESGVIVAFLQYFTMILNAMIGVSRIFVMTSKAEASAKRVAAVLETPADLAVQPQEAEEASEETPAHIEFQDVSFSYTGVGHNLQHLSFRLEHGESLGILGATGSGKTTILNLLQRFYDVTEGRILIDGQDVRTIDPDTLRAKFGVVFQNDFVMGGTIGENIRFFRDVSDRQAQQAADHAQAAPFIAEKENGMDYEVAVRGNNLSGGQKQRLLIARALAARPEILLLDDASSALDYRTDALLRRALRKNYPDTTTILIAQRVSSICHCSRILMLDDGAVLGYGTHEELLKNCEEYAIIARTQMGDGREDA